VHGDGDDGNPAGVEGWYAEFPRKLEVNAAGIPRGWKNCTGFPRI